MAILLPSSDPDGLMTPRVRTWSEEKLKVMASYCRVFTNSMKGKWAGLNYIDLFSGCGLGKADSDGRLILGSPLLAMSVPKPFDRYILCEKNAVRLSALSARVARLYPGLDVSFVRGDCNDSVSKIVENLPRRTPGSSHLTFCFIDPYGLRFRFATIESLVSACGKIDFLVLLALGMDGRRNERVYVEGKSPIVDDLLGDVGWRERWNSPSVRGITFGKFVADEFADRMFDLGYFKPLDWRLMEFKDLDKNIPLYHLAFFSKDPLAYKFWNECIKYSRGQQSLGLGI